MRYSVLPSIPVTATPEQREIARNSELYDKGDMILVWINEGDLDTCCVPATLEQTTPRLTREGYMVAYFLGAFGLMLSQVGLGVIIYDPHLYGWGLLMALDGLILAFLCWSAVHLNTLEPLKEEEHGEV
jgi:hypothetical protein